MYICGFSGPPHCGKDSIAKTIMGIIDGPNDVSAFTVPVTIASLAYPMREIGMTLLGKNPNDDAEYARLKEEGQSLLRRTIQPELSEHDCGNYNYETDDNLRQFMIAISEQFIKPRYGQDFWARCLRQLVEEDCSNDLILIPDIGFESEVKYFEQWLGRENVLIVQVARKDTDFSKDSRSYISTDGYNMPLENNASLEWAAQQVIAKMENIGWNIR